METLDLLMLGYLFNVSFNRYSFKYIFRYALTHAIRT